MLDNFPDSRIGASLKEETRQLYDAVALNFPDSRIGASLKMSFIASDRRGTAATSPIRESGPH